MENSEICEWLRLSFLQIVCEQDEYEVKATHSCFIDTENLIHILIDGEEESVTFSKLVSILLFGRKQIALVFTQSGFELIYLVLESGYLAFFGPEVGLYKFKLFVAIQP